MRTTAIALIVTVVVVYVLYGLVCLLGHLMDYLVPRGVKFLLGDDNDKL